MKSDFSISDFDKEMYRQLEKYEFREKSHKSRGRGVTIMSLAKKLNVSKEAILKSYEKLEILGICEIRSKNKCILKKC